ncbi:hypothetical protein BJ322DRAFT_1111630 [Thelephora terrestris]|uniref:DUF6593 domain-containing protein n=1 Tax=Thelephora terrestris TaxID=56493 RepID=A0A9P6L4B2_9AGAM|nr:hypothetical protein BJ322DRAFT_1111630 [Thelephora terrestris]
MSGCVLRLARNSPLRTALVEEATGNIKYRIETPLRIARSVTRIRKFESHTPPPPHLYEGVDGAEPESQETSVEITRIYWKWFSPSRIIFMGRITTRDEFLPRCGKMKGSFTFTGPDGVQYRWALGAMGMNPGRLVTTDEKKTVIAEFHRPHYFINKQKARIEVQPAGMDILDYIIVTTLRRWRRSFFSKPKTVDIDSIVVNVYGGCMGLPQEVVERVMRMLQDNRRALKACSLTCKAMFASTRHLIHQTLHLTTGNNQKVLTLRERKQHPQKDHPELALRLLPLMAERGLLRYARHLNIDLRCDFSPPLLGPHLQHLQSLDRIHTLTVHWCNPFVSRVIYDSSFSNFYPTLTTLVLHSSIHDDHRYVPHFIRQFPNLQNLTFRSLRSPPLDWTAFREPLVVSQAPPPPPLRGHLRCINVTPGTPLWPKSFPSDLPCSLNFRSVEFQNVHCSNGQQILDLCAGTLEEFTICIDRKGEREVETSSLQCDAVT